MGKGLIVFLLIAVITAMISAVSQMMKNAQAAAPRPQNRPRPGNDDIDRFLQEIDRLRKKREEPSEPPVARPVVARPVRPTTATPVSESPPATSPRKSSRLSQEPDFVPSQVTRPVKHTGSVMDTERPPSSHSKSAEPAVPPPLPRLEDLPVAPPTTSPPMKPLPKTPVTTRQEPTSEQSAFTEKLMQLFSTPGSLPLAIIMQEILNPPRCKRPHGA